MTDMIRRARQAAGFVPGDDAAHMTAGADDRALLRRYVQAGTEDAFAQIVYRHAGWIYHACRRGLGDAHLAEDATQAVFLLLAKKAPAFPPGVHVGGWLSQACRFVLADVRKNRARYVRRQEMARQRAMQHHAVMESPEAQSIDPDTSAALDEALASLRDGDRQAILMHFYEGMTVGEMADRLGIEQEAAKKRLARALSRLRERISGIRGRRAAVPLAVVLLLLRSRSAEAVPGDLAWAIARAATTPGWASAGAETMATAVHTAHALAATRLWATLNMVQMPILAAATAAMLLCPWGDGQSRFATRPPGGTAVAAVTPSRMTVRLPAATNVSGAPPTVSRDIPSSPGEPLPGDVFESAEKPAAAVAATEADEAPMLAASAPTDAIASGGGGIIAPAFSVPRAVDTAHAIQAGGLPERAPSRQSSNARIFRSVRHDDGKPESPRQTIARRDGAAEPCRTPVPAEESAVIAANAPESTSLPPRPMQARHGAPPALPPHWGRPGRHEPGPPLDRPEVPPELQEAEAARPPALIATVPPMGKRRGERLNQLQSLAAIMLPGEQVGLVSLALPVPRAQRVVALKADEGPGTGAFAFTPPPHAAMSAERNPLRPKAAHAGQLHAWAFSGEPLMHPSPLLEPMEIAMPGWHGGPGFIGERLQLAPPSADATVVPEPTSGWCLVFAVAALGRRRRRK